MYDESTMTRIDGASENDGWTYIRDLPFFAEKKVIVREKTEERVLREYPETGGKDVEMVVVVPEKAEWHVYGPSGDDETGEVDVPDFVKANGGGEFFVPSVVFHRCTDEEKDELKRSDESLESIDDALCELYETTLAQSAIMDDQDAAICALYEMMEA